MYPEKNDIPPEYDVIINALKNGMIEATNRRDRSHISYVLLRAMMLSWLELGGGYNNGSDVRAIIADVHEEFSARMAQALKNRRKNVGDVTDPIVLPKPKPSTNIVDSDGKPLQSQNKGDEKNENNR